MTTTSEYDLVIKDGMIFDGTGAPRVRGDVGIADGRILAMGRIDASAATEVIDARGMHVAPGFVDLHTHYDAQVFWDPYCTLSGWHGITSVAIGNCGFGFAPVAPEQREHAMRSMTRVEAIPYESMRLGMPWDWVTFPEYLESLDRTPKALNILPYVPAGPMLVDVLGLEDAKAGRMPTEEEHHHAGTDVARVDGRRWLRLVRPAPSSHRSSCCAARLGRHTHADRRDARRDLPGLCQGAGRAEPRCATGHPHHRRHSPRRRPSRRSRHRFGPTSASQRGTGFRGPAPHSSSVHRVARTL